MTSPLPAYAVPGIESSDTTGDPRRVSYLVGQLAAFPVVAAAVAETPQVLSAICADDPQMREAFAQTREDLCMQLRVGTADGHRWWLTFRDAVKLIVQTDEEYFPADLIQEALEAQPGVEAVDHADHELFYVQMADPQRADEMAARWLRAVITAHRDFAHRRDIALPY
ncbi:hypothetical protein KZZ52_52475 [Dactylosporangium sp. AC04546]|uniref:hypothetical protein n=1 Tax=Dactylosporangium sp. AC04546 TaxID=2862460 RepID=UPI001EDDD54A|nr:hypothetical protein [Dactylosporangium sp. AC04546]WVK82478.1 hypothetical protein KZZ52_52475 [Dactylosporangium sp. AC04546]